MSLIESLTPGVGLTGGKMASAIFGMTGSFDSLGSAESSSSSGMVERMSNCRYQGRADLFLGLRIPELIAVLTFGLAWLTANIDSEELTASLGLVELSVDLDGLSSMVW